MLIVVFAIDFLLVIRPWTSFKPTLPQLWWKVIIFGLTCPSLVCKVNGTVNYLQILSIYKDLRSQLLLTVKFRYINWTADALLHESVELLYSLTYGLQTRWGPARTDNCSTPSSWSPVRRMPPTTTPAATTPSARRSWTSCWTGCASWATSAPGSRASSCSIASAAAPAPASRRCSWNASPWTTARRASWSSPSIPPHRWVIFLFPLYTPSLIPIRINCCPTKRAPSKLDGQPLKLLKTLPV